ncbi:MAG: transglutaminase-like domain-containing protein, partial [Candidatus Baldrarchaeia archaeon]
MARRAIAVTLSFILALLSLLSASTILYKPNMAIPSPSPPSPSPPPPPQTPPPTPILPPQINETEYFNLSFEVSPLINTYWKIQCYNYYNGTVWSKTNTLPAIFINTTNLPLILSSLNITPTYNRTVRIENINFTSTINSITLPLPWNMTALLSFKLESSQPINYTLYIDTHGCLNLYVNTQNLVQVQITYNVSISSPMEQNIEKGSWEDIPPNIIQMYTQVPTLSPDFIRFAESLRLENSTLWQQIQHVTKHFYLNFTITEENIPTNITDPVTWVVINKRGPLDWVTTAYILTLRWLGVPARYVEGFKHGLHDFVANKTIINKNYTYCWAEVYVPKMGWGVIDLNERIFPESIIPTCLPLNYGVYISILNVTPREAIRGLDNITIVAILYESLCGEIDKTLLLNESLYGKVNPLPNVTVNLYIDNHYISSSLTNLTGFVEFNYFVESNMSVGTHEVLVNCSFSALNLNDTDTFNVLPEYIIQIKVDKKYGLKSITRFNFDFNLFTPEPSKINYSEIVIKPLAYLTETGENLTLPEVYLDENGFGTLTYIFNLNGAFIISANATLKDGKPLLTISDQVKIIVYPTNLTVITYLNATTILRKYEVENITIIAKVSAIGNSSITIPLTTNITINLNETFLNLTTSNGLKTLYIRFNISGLHNINISYVEFPADISNFIFIDISSGQNYSNYIQVLVVSEFNVQIEANPYYDIIRNETKVTFTIYTFNLSVPSSGNFTIIDETDNIIIADGLSNQSGIAIIEYIFPLNSTLGLHTIKVVFNDVTNTTYVWIYSETKTTIYTDT